MVVGDPRGWVGRFRSIDIRLLQCIASIWPACRNILPSQPEEDTITINLIAILSKDAEARRLCYGIEYHFEPFGHSADGTAYSKGQIDMAVFLDQDREKYLAYECKRLNVQHGVRRSSLATRYVMEGIRRFVTGQYAERLPVGSMLGYVMDGDISFAKARVDAAIDANKVEVKLVFGPTGANPVSIIQRFSTEHGRKDGSRDIEIRHGLLPFPLIRE